MQHAVCDIFEFQHVFARVFDFAVLTEFSVKRVDLLRVFEREVYVYAGHAEAQRHRLAKIVILSTDAVRCTGTCRQIGIARGIDEIVGLKGHFAALAHDRHGLNAVTIALGTQQVGVEQHIYAALFGHLVKNEL